MLIATGKPLTSAEQDHWYLTSFRDRVPRTQLVGELNVQTGQSDTAVGASEVRLWHSVPRTKVPIEVYEPTLPGVSTVDVETSQL